ncbi:hypothetical protein NE865_15940 [Phthorimaea operculella]|nr:hypothetical protein NE865_15940 [Phthorimaea operculella]
MDSVRHVAVAGSTAVALLPVVFVAITDMEPSFVGFQAILAENVVLKVTYNVYVALLSVCCVNISSSAVRMMKMTMFLQCKRYHGNRSVTFTVDELVLVQIFQNQKTQWVKGRITKKLGSAVYLVRILDRSRTVKKHANQILKYRGEEDNQDCSPEQPIQSIDPIEEPTELPPLVIELHAEAVCDNDASHSSDPVANDTTAIAVPQHADTESNLAQRGNSSDAVTPREESGDGSGDESDQWAEGVSSPSQMPQDVRDEDSEQVSPEQVETAKRTRKIVDYRKFF